MGAIFIQRGDECIALPLRRLSYEIESPEVTSLQPEIRWGGGRFLGQWIYFATPVTGRERADISAAICWCYRWWLCMCGSKRLRVSNPNCQQL